MRRTIPILIAVAVLAACSAETPTATLVQREAHKKPGGGGGTSDPATTWLLPLEAGELAFRSDGQYASNGYSTYAHGVCSVTGKLFLNGSGDATIQTDVGKGKNPCTRTFTVTYPDGVTETFRSFNNLRVLQTTSTVIPVGSQALRTLAINPGVLTNNPSRCGRLLFGEGNQGGGAGSDSVVVTRISADTWEVESQAAPNNRALCEDTGELYPMPVRFRLVSSVDLPG
jgi:hypothetical protein